MYQGGPLTQFSIDVLALDYESDSLIDKLFAVYTTV
jgi:hypothetical protein